MTPQVSILLPVYQGGEDLAACLSSLLAQSHRDFEIICVDDGSTDDTPSILARYASRDSRVRVYSGAHQGIVAALQRCVAHSRGTVLARMDADDVALPDRLELQCAALEDDATLACVGSRVAIEGGGDSRGMRRYQEWLNRSLSPEEIAKEIFVESPLAHPTVVMRRSAYDSVGGYRRGPWPEDYDLWLRFHARGLRMRKLPEVLLRWRDSPGRASRNDRRYAAHAFWQCKTQHFDSCYPIRSRPIVIWGAGRSGRRWGRWVTETGGRLDAWIDVDPRKIGRHLQTAPVLSPDGLGAPAGQLLLIAVGGVLGAAHAGADAAETPVRDRVRAFLGERGWVERVDFVCVE